jgi:hypothetical protein
MAWSPVFEFLPVVFSLENFIEAGLFKNKVYVCIEPGAAFMGVYLSGKEP